MSGKKNSKLVLLSNDNAVILKEILCKNGIDASVEPIEAGEHPCRNFYAVNVDTEQLTAAAEILGEFVCLNKSRVRTDKNKVVLVPVDFSDYSMKACDAGFRYASRHQLTVCILHSFISEYYSETLPPGIKILSEKMRREKSPDKKLIAQNQMASFVEQIRRKITEGEFPDVKFEVLIEEGIPETVISEYTEKHEPAIIIMGTRGKHQKEEDLIGSVTAEVIDSTDAPMLIIPNTIDTNDVIPVRNIAFYCNLDKTDVETFKGFFAGFDTEDCKVSILHIQGKRERFVPERLDAFCRYCRSAYPKCSFEARLFEEDTFLADFDAYLKQKGVRLLVLPNKKRNLFMRLFNPSIAHKVFFHTDIAMLIIPASSDEED